MNATSTLEMTDLSRQKNYRTDLSGDLTPEHDVDQAIDHYLQESRIPRHGMRWVAVSRGRRLDSKRQLLDLPDLDAEWRVLPEATAGVS